MLAKRIYDALAATVHLDATTVPLASRALEHVYAKAYEVEYPELKAANGDVLPIDSSVDRGAEQWTYYQYDAVGFAKFWNPMANDIPMATLKGTQRSGPMRSIVEGYQYTLQDMRALSFAKTNAEGIPNLDALRAKMVRRHHDQLWNTTWLFGQEDLGLLGLLTHPNITITDSGADGGSGVWAAAGTTVAEILADLFDLIETPAELSNGVETVTKVMLPRPQMNLIKSTRLDDTNSDLTIWQFVFGPNGVYSDVETEVLNELEAANSDGELSVDIGIALVEEVDKASFIVGQEFEQLPPIELGFKYEVHTHSRIGGAKIQRPLAIHRLNNI